MEEQVMIISTEEAEVQSTYLLRWKAYQPLFQSKPSSTKSIEEIKTILGSVYVPVYMPKGYSLKYNGVFLDDSVRSVYQNKTSFLELYQSPRQAKIKVKPGYFKPIQVNNGQGYLIRGKWHGKLKEDMREGELIPLEWDATGLQYLVFELEGWTISINNHFPRDEEGMGEDELVKIGESLRLI